MTLDLVWEEEALGVQKQVSSNEVLLSSLNKHQLILTLITIWSKRIRYAFLKSSVWHGVLGYVCGVFLWCGTRPYICGNQSTESTLQPQTFILIASLFMLRSEIGGLRNVSWRGKAGDKVHLKMLVMADTKKIK